MKLSKTRLLLTVVLLSVSCYLHSQVFQVYNAGYALTNYVDIVPDTLINYIIGPQAQNEAYDIDVNGDLENDLRIQAWYAYSMVWSNRIIEIVSLNPNSYARFGRYDSVPTFTGGWWVTKVAMPLQYADTINSGTSVWDSVYLTLTDDSMITGDFKNITDWISPDDKYITLKYQDSTDTIYGWIRVNCPVMNVCLIKDYSFSSFYTVIQETESNKFNIYPIPATDKIFIGRTNSEEMEVCLFDIAGRQVMETRQSNSKITEIDVSGIRKGYYILRLTDNDNSFNKKIVIE